MSTINYRAIADGWLGTPFHPNACIKGAGVSCQKLAGAIYIEAGIWPAGFEIPDAAMDWSHAHKDSLIERFMDARPEFAGRAPSPGVPLLPGDLLGIRIGGCVHHCGLVVDTAGTFVHVVRNATVSYASAKDASFLSRIDRVWRPVLISAFAL